MNASLNRPEAEIKKLLQDYFQNDYSIKDFCILSEITEAELQQWIEKYPEEKPSADDGFIELVQTEDRKSSGRPKKPQATEPILFARVTPEAIEIFRETSAGFLKSLR